MKISQILATIARSNFKISVAGCILGVIGGFTCRYMIVRERVFILPPWYVSLLMMLLPALLASAIVPYVAIRNVRRRNFDSAFISKALDIQPLSSSQMKAIFLSLGIFLMTFGLTVAISGVPGFSPGVVLFGFLISSIGIGVWCGAYMVKS